MSAAASPLIECVRLTKQFGHTLAVRDVSLNLYPGQVLGLVGENGAGKTTLLSMIAGEVRPDRGTITVHGKEKTFGSPHQARAEGIAIVHQELSLFPNLTVAENVAMGREPRKRNLIDVDQVNRSSETVLTRLGMNLDVRQMVAQLSPAEQQMVEIAKALYWGPRVLILDEPTSSLESQEVRTLAGIIRKLSSESGHCVVFVSHRLDEVLELTDTLAVMRDGELVGVHPTHEMTRDRLVTLMVGRAIDTVYPGPVAGETPTQPLLQLRNVSAGPVKNLSLEISSGVIVGIGGLEGQGQHALAEIVAGARVPTSGVMLMDGKVVRFKSPRDAIKRRIVYVPPDRNFSGLMRPLTIKNNVALAALGRLSVGGFVRDRMERRRVVDTVNRLRLRYARLSQSVSELSGGGQQKVLFGRWLMLPDVKLMVLDDPTRGVDIGARAEIYNLLRELSSRGLGILLISTDLIELIGISDVIHVMYEGTIVGTMPAQEATEESVMRLATGASDAA
ncbi:MAG TPA: sugar ABC transporter ATP-binding protein [Chloroflexota bacterium]